MSSVTCRDASSSAVAVADLAGMRPPSLRTLGLALCVMAAAWDGLRCKASAADAIADEVPLDGPLPEVSVPAENGPKLVPTKALTPVYERPSAKARVLGELRAGGAVSRSAEPFTRAGCAAGWYVVRPKGFVCADGAHLDGVARAELPAPPELARPLPYRYARARFETVAMYTRVPSAAEQAALEPDLTKHLRRPPEDEPLGPAANDVSLDPRGVPLGPPVLLPTSEGVDPTGKRSWSTFLLFPGDPAAAGPMLPVGAGPEHHTVEPLRRNGGVAFTRTVLVDGGGVPRRMGVTPSGALVPVDRMRPTTGATWHGVELGTAGAEPPGSAGAALTLPIAFVLHPNARTYTLTRGKATRNDESDLERRLAVPLTGRYRTLGGTRYEEMKDGSWIRSMDAVTIVKRHKLPDFAKGTQKWLDVSLANQTVTAYEGNRAVFATLISSGRHQLGDPATTSSTPRGTFQVRAKHVTRTLDAREIEPATDLHDAPWVLELADPARPGGAAPAEGATPGFPVSIAGTYWNDPVGEPHAFHGVLLTPIDARRIWTWADPQLPDGWHGVADVGEATTIVHLRP